MNNKTFYLIVLLMLGGSGLFWFWMFQGRPAISTTGEEVVEVTMYRSNGCECCLRWAAHLESNGFEVNDQLVSDIHGVKTDNRIPQSLTSCHTAIIGGYVVEGHLPAGDIRRLISEQPDARGISVPGMPIGSPGMEGENSQPYDVILFDDAGNRTVFARH